MMNEQRITNTFMDLVRIDSPSGEEGNIAAHIERVLDALKISHQRDNYGNVIARIEGKGEPRMLCAHLDTVEPGRGVQPVVENGVIRSAGETILGADNKAAVAAILEVFTVLCKRDVSHAPVEAIFTRSEETGNYGALNLEYSLIHAKKGFCFDSGQPVGTIIIAAPFYNRIDVALHGRATHASRPEEGINPIGILNAALSKITLGGLDDESIFNIGMIRGGEARNSVPDRIDLQCELRSYSEEKVETHTVAVRNIFQDAAAHAGGGAAVEAVRENDGYSLTMDNAFLNATQERIQRIGIVPCFKKTWGCADNCIFRARGLEVLNLGYGAVNIHTAEEAITVRDLCEVSRVMLALLQSD
ncbi:MAG: M20/M25/M40 family metallo-hydrolase [Patescibacteria group bacterium]|nr:M20/M25/M40 family metallo-hydrolase [Patescibacteria group bacterium]